MLRRVVARVKEIICQGNKDCGKSKGKLVHKRKGSVQSERVGAAF